MMRIKDEVLHMDRMMAVPEHLIGFILKEIIDPEGELYDDGHPVPKSSASTS
jgi:hypothetical protein